MRAGYRSDRNRLGRVALALGLLGPAAAAAGAQGESAPNITEAGRGQTIYKRFCASCHGPAGAGNGPIAKDLRTRPTDLTRLAERNGGVFPFDKVARAIDGRETPRVHGPADMPVWGEIFGKTSGADTADTGEAVSRLTHYVWTLQQARGR